MDSITPELREKFMRFREIYEFTRETLEADGAAGKVIAAEVWKAAQAAVPLTPDELHLYKMSVALHSVNGGELFADPDHTE